MRVLSGVFRKPKPNGHSTIEIDSMMADLRKRNIISRFRVQTILDEVVRVESISAEAAPEKHT